MKAWLVGLTSGSDTSRQGEQDRPELGQSRKETHWALEPGTLPAAHLRASLLPGPSQSRVCVCVCVCVRVHVRGSPERLLWVKKGCVQPLATLTKCQLRVLLDGGQVV